MFKKLFVKLNYLISRVFLRFSGIAKIMIFNFTKFSSHWHFLIFSSDPLGPATIILLLDDCPLPTKETVVKLTSVFDLSSQKSKEGRNHPIKHRNMTIVLGCIAEKLAGPRSVALFTLGTLDYLISNLVSFKYIFHKKKKKIFYSLVWPNHLLSWRQISIKR